MNKQIIKLLVGFIISSVVLISIGCPGKSSQNPEDKKIVEAIYKTLENDPQLKKQVKNIKITYANKTIELKGHIYGQKNLLTLYRILFDVNNVSRQFKKDDSNTEDNIIMTIVNKDFTVYFIRGCPYPSCECPGKCGECGVDCLAGPENPEQSGSPDK